jgi:SAM-dependent methyltransferase
MGKARYAAGISGKRPSRVYERCACMMDLNMSRPSSPEAASDGARDVPVRPAVAVEDQVPVPCDHPPTGPMATVLSHNRRGWDKMAAEGHPLTRPASDGQLRDPLASLDLTWIDGGVRGKRILCLAGGGGRQGVLYAAAGGEVTVVDLSPAMLALDRQVAASHGLQLRTILASMDDLSMLGPASFDVVLQPVSTCYVPDVQAVYREVARVLVPSGIYISQHKQPVSLQASVTPGPEGYVLQVPYYHSGPLPAVSGSPHREHGTLEFVHRWEQLLGGLCRAGFVIEDVAEPLHARPAAAPGSFAHRSMYAPPYVRIKARRTGSPTKRVWLPGP